MRTISSILVAALLLSASANAQENSEAGTNWLVNCSNQMMQNQLRCDVSQNIVRQQTSQLVGVMRIFRAEESDVLEVVVPFGVNILDGVTISVDGTELATLPFQTATSTGLFTSVELSDDVLNAFKSGQSAMASVKNSFGQRLDIEFVLAGFSTAFGLYERTMAQ